MYAIRSYYEYWTSWVDADGNLQFRSDLYYRDLDLEVALDEALARVGAVAAKTERKKSVITSYSIHYTKLYEVCPTASSNGSRMVLSRAKVCISSVASRSG